MNLTSAAPARLFCLFALRAPVAIILSRRPSRYTQMIKWCTDTDIVEFGQWIRGRVDSLTITDDAKYAAVKVMGTRSRIGSWEDSQQAFVCRPPYFTALEVYLGGLCYTHAYIASDQSLYTHGENRIVNATNECPLVRSDVWPVVTARLKCIDADMGPAQGEDQRHRQVEIVDGRIYAGQGLRRKLILDANLQVRHNVPPPEWATQW